MKKILLFAFLMLLSFATIKAQCTIDTTMNAGQFSSALPNGCINLPYDESASFRFRADTVVFGQVLNFDSITFDNFINVPTGLSATCDMPTCTWVTDPDPFTNPTRGCVSFAGTPTAAFNDSITIARTYWVTIFGTPTSFSDSIKIGFIIGAAPSSMFSDSTSNLDVTFTDGSTAASGATYLWDFGDGNTSTTQDPAHTYAAAGTYLVCLTVTDACGTDSTCSSVTVTDVGTGLENNWMDNVSVYPMPAKDLLNIAGLSIGADANLTLINNLGQIVYQGNTNGKSNVTIDVTNLSPGTYQMTINTENQIGSRSIMIVK